MLQAWHLLLGIALFLLVSCEEPSLEGLSSTSLVDLPSSLSTLETLDSTENRSDQYTETDGHHALLHPAQGSGFSSQETEEIAIFQSPKFFWDDDLRKVNMSSEDNSETMTDGAETTKSKVTQETSHLPEKVLETSTTMWSTGSDDTPRQVSPAIEAIAAEDSPSPATHNETIAPLPDSEERAVPKMTSTSSSSTIKPPRKNKKHSWSRSHHSSHELESNPHHGAPADSRSHPTGNLPPGHRSHGNMVPNQSSSAANSKMNLNVPQVLSTQPEEDPTKSAPMQISPGKEQVICKDWINLSGKNYIILNMSDDIDCEEFRWRKGHQLLSLLEGVLSWKTEPPQRDWVIFLSKPNENDNHLLMTVTEEERVVPAKDVFMALGDIKRNLAEIGIESYSSTVSCQSRPSPPRSDYGKLFIVLVIIGSLCVMIIVAGLIYICWQRRLPKLKNMELHFVENGCHDNPTLDVAMDSQSEMQEKKQSINGGTSHQADGWETLINKPDKEENEAMEEDTHL